MSRIAQRQRFDVTDDHVIKVVLAISGSKMEVRIRILHKPTWPFREKRINGWTRRMYRGEQITEENIDKAVTANLAKAVEFVAKRERNYSILERLDISVNI